MTRPLLFVFVLAFAGTLGLLQRQPAPILGLLGVAIVVMILRVPNVLHTLVFCIIGGLIAVGTTFIAQQRLQFTPGQRINIQGVVNRQVGEVSWVHVTGCDRRPCISGVLIQQTMSLGTAIAAPCELLPLPDPQQPWRWWKVGIAAECVPTSRLSTTSSAGLSWLYRFRLSLRQRIDETFAPRSAGLLAGILFGDTASMPSSVSNDFRRTGTTHIVALSGFNVTIILQVLVGSLLPLFGKRWTMGLGFVLVVLFVMTTGASSSVVRATVMAVVVQAVRFVGRPVHPDRVLLLTTVVMSIQNPWLLWHDLGFQLSMTSTFGLLQLRPALERFGQWLPTGWELRDNALSTAAASVASAPLLLGTFGGWSLISLIANVIVLPCIPLIMGLGALVVPLLWLPEHFRDVLIAPVDLLLRFVLGTLHLLSEVPGAYQQLPSWAILLCTGVSLIGIAWLYATSTHHSH